MIVSGAYRPSDSAGRPGTQQLRLADRVRVIAAEEQHRRLAAVVDGRQVRLDEDRAPRGQQGVGVLRARARHRRGPYRAVSRDPTETVGLITYSPPGGANLSPGLDQPGRRRVRDLEQIALVGVPGDDRGIVEHPRNRSRPLQERLAAAWVVPGGAGHDEVVVRPVDGRVVPHGRLGVHPALRQLGDHEPLVVGELGEVGAGGEGDAGGHGRPTMPAQAPTCGSGRSGTPTRAEPGRRSMESLVVLPAGRPEAARNVRSPGEPQRHAVPPPEDARNVRSPRRAPTSRDPGASGTA